MGILEKGILCILAAFLLYIEAVLLWLMSLDWHRSQWLLWDRLGKRGTGLPGKGKRMLRSRGQGERPWN